MELDKHWVPKPPPRCLNCCRELAVFGETCGIYCCVQLEMKRKPDLFKIEWKP